MVIPSPVSIHPRVHAPPPLASDGDTPHVLAVPSPGRPRPGVGNQAGDATKAVEVRPDRLLRLAGGSGSGHVRGRTFRLCGSAKRAALALTTSRHNTRPAGRVSQQLPGSLTANPARPGDGDHSRVHREFPWPGEGARHSVRPVWYRADVPADSPGKVARPADPDHAGCSDHAAGAGVPGRHDRPRTDTAYSGAGSA